MERRGLVPIIMMITLVIMMMLLIMILVIMMVMAMIHICDNDAIHGGIIGDNDGDDDNCSS